MALTDVITEIHGTPASRIAQTLSVHEQRRLSATPDTTSCDCKRPGQGDNSCMRDW
jgi:hypothetical protein